MISARQQIDRVAEAGDDHHVPDAWYLGQCLVHDRLHGDAPAAAVTAIDGDHGLGLAVVQAGGDRVGAEAGEQRHDDGADAGDREQRRGGFGHQGHIEADDVAAAQAERLERGDDAVGFADQLGVGPASLRPIFALPDEIGLRGAPLLEVLLQAGERQVGGAVDTPFGERHAVGEVENLGIGLDEAESDVADERVPEPFRVGIGAGQQVRVAAEVGFAQERGPVGVAPDRLVREPGVAGVGGLWCAGHMRCFRVIWYQVKRPGNPAAWQGAVPAAPVRPIPSAPAAERSPGCRRTPASR